MRLVHQKNVPFRRHVLREIAPQVDQRVEHIVIVADKDIAEFRQFQLQLIRAKSVILRRLFQHAACVAVAVIQQVAQRGRNAVVKPRRPGAHQRIAMRGDAARIFARLAVRADAVARGQDNGSEVSACVINILCGAEGFAAGARLCGQVEHAVAASIPECADCGI